MQTFRGVQVSIGVSRRGAGNVDAPLAISDGAARREPQVLDWQRYLARAHSGVGDVLAARNAAAALPHYRESVRIFDGMALPYHPGSRRSRTTWRMPTWRWGTLLGNPGLPNVGDSQALAKEAYAKSQTINQGLSPHIRRTSAAAWMWACWKCGSVTSKWGR